MKSNPLLNFGIIVMAVFLFFLLLAKSCQGASIRVDLAWDAPNDTNVAAYRVYVATNILEYNKATNDFAFNTWTNFPAASTNATVTNVPLSTHLVFWVTACDKDGYESLPSNSVEWDSPTRPKPPVVRLRIVIESSGTDPKGPWTIERQLEDLELADVSQKFFRSRVTATIEP